MVRLFALQTDPDTDKAAALLTQANIAFQLVDVESAGVLACLGRDLDVRELPFILSGSGKVEGLKAIQGFVALRK